MSRTGGRTRCGEAPVRRDEVAREEIMSKHPRRPLDELEAFDPGPSLRAGVSILERSGAPYALAGRLAVWTYVPPARQEFTKDADFAVPHDHIGRAAEVAREMGYQVRKLPLGYAVEGEGISIDFVDHHPHYERLYLEAVKAARREAAEGETPIVPLDYLIAMKIGARRTEDERDVRALLPLVDGDEYQNIRRLVHDYLGRVAALDLDILAREIGHPGPGPEWTM